LFNDFDLQVVDGEEGGVVTEMILTILVKSL